MLLLASTLQLSAQSRQYLHEGWTFGEARFPNRYPAQVPGVVHTDLLRQGLIDDPYIGLNERKVQWVDKEDWVSVEAAEGGCLITLKADKFVRALALSVDGAEDCWFDNNYFDLLPGVPAKCFLRTSLSPSEIRQRLTYRSL